MGSKRIEIAGSNEIDFRIWIKFSGNGRNAAKT